MRHLVLAMAIPVVVASAGCEGKPLDPCDYEGAYYQCTCTQMCQGSSSTYQHTWCTNTRTDAVNATRDSCYSSCASATCSSCTCGAAGSACTGGEHSCH